MQVKIPEAFGGLFTPMRYKVYYGGRGGAKSWAFAIALLTIGLSRPIRVLCARELQTSIKDSVHKLLSDVIASHPHFQAHYDVQAQAILGKEVTLPDGTKARTEFSFRGLKHNATEIKSFEGADYVWVEEAQAVSDNSWEILVPTIRKEGSEIWVCFNPKNPTDPTWTRFVQRKRENAIVRKVGWQDNPFFPKVLNDERLDDKINNPDAYDHIWEGAFDTRFSGSVYAKWLQQALEQGRIRPGLYDPELLVHTAWDLGYDDSTAIVWWQKSGNEVRIIDCYENSQQDIKHYCEQVLGYELVENYQNGKIAYTKGDAIDKLERRRQYKYGDHFVPHDAANKLLAAGGRSIVQQAHEMGVKTRVVAATSQQNQIEATRKVLNTTYWDEKHAQDVILAMNSYHFEHDPDRKIFKSTPVHDWSSHFADAVEIIGQAMKLPTEQVKPPEPRFLEQMTANELFYPTTTTPTYSRI